MVSLLHLFILMARQREPVTSACLMVRQRILLIVWYRIEFSQWPVQHSDSQIIQTFSFNFFPANWLCFLSLWLIFSGRKHLVNHWPLLYYVWNSGRTQKVGKTKMILPFFIYSLKGSWLFWTLLLLQRQDLLRE